MHKVFISYHHENDQLYKDKLLKLNKQNPMFIDGSVETNDISDELDDQMIRQKIRDEYLRDTTVTILLVGIETKNRKHVDWELYSSMFDGKVNKKSAMIVIMLPTTNCTRCNVVSDKEKQILYPDISSWTTINERAEYENFYPYLPDRIIDNLLINKAKISVTNFDVIVKDPSKLNFLVNEAFNNRSTCEYDLSRPMRRNNS